MSVQWQLNHFKATLGHYSMLTRANKSQGSRRIWSNVDQRSKKNKVKKKIKKIFISFPHSWKQKVSQLSCHHEENSGISPGTFPHCQNTLYNTEKSGAMSTLQLLWLRPLPLERNRLPHLAEPSVPYSHHSHTSIGQIKVGDCLRGSAGRWREQNSK